MRNCHIYFILIVLLSWKVTICSAQSIPVDSIITPSSLKVLVQTLSADSFQGRLTGTMQAAQAADFIIEQFKQAGALPIAGNDGYLMPFMLSYKENAFSFPIPYKAKSLNVVAALPGHSKPKELVIFSAHFDHIGTQSYTIRNKMPENGKPEAGDEIYNGANDNASGISALIHLVRFFAQHPNNERTLIFIAFSGEEEGLLGSKHLSEGFDPKVVAAMVNMDMIGRPIDDKKPYITGDEQSNLLPLLNKRLFAMAPQYGSAYFQSDRFPSQRLYMRSDNYPFARRGMVAHTIMSTSPNDNYYHSLNDEWETLDYPFMAEVVKAIALATTGLADGADTPKKY